MIIVMELRVLQYFLAVTREQSISKAAESLHLSQPTLSRQMDAVMNLAWKKYQVFTKAAEKFLLKCREMLE